MKILKYIGLILVVAFTVSCEKNQIEYMTDSLGDKAEFQLDYFVPVTATSTNYIYKVEVNGQLIANSKAPLSTYNAIPNGAVSLYYSVDPGTVNLKLYKGTSEELVYDQDVTLAVGKQSVFVYDFSSSPIVFDSGYPYSANLTTDTDSTCYVKFFNFLYETEGVPCDLKLQYQYVDPRTSEMVNIGSPVSFGETTGWQPVKVLKSDFNSSGSVRVDYKIKVVDANGAITGDLQLWNSSKKYVSYSDYWTEYIGRRYQHVIGGMRSAVPVASVKQFTIL
ncbi:MAG: hypothetical protein WC384_12480 [Prolixibacteraceae bacterium]